MLGLFNRSPAMVPLTAPLFGVFFLGGVSPSKIGLLVEQWLIQDWSYETGLGSSPTVV
jgi:hypothetical protein